MRNPRLVDFGRGLGLGKPHPPVLGLLARLARIRVPRRVSAAPVNMGWPPKSAGATSSINRTAPIGQCSAAAPDHGRSALLLRYRRWSAETAAVSPALVAACLTIRCTWEGPRGPPFLDRKTGSCSAAEPFSPITSLHIAPASGATRAFPPLPFIVIWPPSARGVASRQCRLQSSEVLRPIAQQSRSMTWLRRLGSCAMSRSASACVRRSLGRLFRDRGWQSPAPRSLARKPRRAPQQSSDFTALILRARLA
jgi:hypothetical protein